MGVYGNYANESYAKTRSRCEKIGTVLFYYSYNTIVAFELGDELFISKNVWSVTTGKHLNWICRDKSIRMDYQKFLELLQKAQKILMENKYYDAEEFKRRLLVEVL